MTGAIPILVTRCAATSQVSWVIRRRMDAWFRAMQRLDKPLCRKLKLPFAHQMQRQVVIDLQEDSGSGNDTGP